MPPSWTRRVFPLLVALSLSLSLPAQALDQTAPDFSLRSLDGKVLRLSELTGEGRVVLINFWATWCGPCQVEMPHIQRMYDTYKDRGLTVLSVSVDDARSASQVKPLVRRGGYSFPVMVDTDGKVATLYNPNLTVPYTVIVDRAGEVAYVHTGYQPGDEAEIEAELAKLLE